MTDEQQVRALLTRAAELPDAVQPPVARLVESARRTRRLRAAGSVLAVAVLVAAAFVLPPAIRSLFPTGVSGSAATYAGTGPTAAQLSRFRWSALPASPLGKRSDPLLAVAAGKLIELGGTKNGVTQSDGAVFAAATGRWARIAHVKGNVGFVNAVDVWTGSQLFVTNGQTGSCPGAAPVSRCLPRAGLYDPATNRWTTTVLPRQLDGLTLAAAVWTGRDVIVAGTNPAHSTLGVAAYTPSTGRWRTITPRLPRHHPASYTSVVATPRRVILWSLWSRARQTSKRSSEITSGVDVLALTSDGRWTNVTGNWPQGQTFDAPSYANGQILGVSDIWCGTCSHPAIASWPILANAATLARTGPSESPARPRSFGSFWRWNGRAVLTAAVGGYGKAAPRGRLGQLAAWDPTSRRWYVLPAAPGKPALGAEPVFVANRLLVLTLDGSLLALGQRS